MPALIGAAVVGGGALIGAGVSHGLERRRQKKRDETAAGQAEAARVTGAIVKEKSGSYGDSASKKRGVVRALVEPAREQQQQSQYELKQAAAIGGGFGRSGALQKGYAGAGRDLTLATAQAGATADTASTASALNQKAEGAAILGNQRAKEERDSLSLLQRRRSGMKTGATLGTQIAAGVPDAGLAAGAGA